ncbi:3-keto-5-aminohexanoate cleavage protein [Bradymonas sediminis]|uniref:3-keto-5-aminohexanoate cleavage protein n=1 Tax=Bradymonas sediminis TaxID=1548548 RepID=A0A2Z4FLL6_9DELT|nr:3-keto-5-aminohexanoate cleavage protein [Bradymonas sediminis]AWV89822.1 3-keto-5-aminohexanoate cleavage protein [Bradymonas sediminis]TDP76431.1 3-keto-5-aminohexanoate cleavage enzyme [Bradymonas sediminis]
MTQPLIITAAVNGAETMREHNPNVPYTPEEIALEAVRCREAGASMVHVHGREDDGTPTQARGAFAEILTEIRERSDILVQFSTGGAVWMSVEERIEALDLRPDMATLTTGTVNFGEDVFQNSLPLIRTIAERLNQYSVRPEIEIFDTGMVDTALRLVKEGLLAGPLHFDFVLGVPGGMGGRPENLDFLVGMIPEGSTWTVAGIGRYELALAKKAIDMGGHVRVGLEDNVFVSKGVLAKGSHELVAQVAEYARARGREIATPAIARELLSLG